MTSSKRLVGAVAGHRISMDTTSIAPAGRIAGVTISSAVTVSVSLDTGSYPGHLTVTQTGSLNGGDGPGVYARFGLDDVAITNQGTITGGELFSVGGLIGVALSSEARVVNTGVINGGAGVYPDLHGATAVGMYDGGTLLNTGRISGGDAGYPEPDSYATDRRAGDGVFGVFLRVVNRGLIEGGNGGGGVGLNLSQGQLDNAGTIAAGTGGSGLYTEAGAGGPTGALLAQSTGVNTGSIMGGAGGGGGAGADGGNGGVGGAGITLQFGTFRNHGVVVGGAGGAGGYAFVGTAGVGGQGGAGVDISSGTFSNSGTITGGAGGAGGASGTGYGIAGAGGAGILLNGGTLVNAGTISGGAGSPGVYADAVRFGNAAATLMVQAGAVFVGDVAGNAAVDDQMILTGAKPGTLSGLGTRITGITRTAITPSANWTLTGDNSVVAGTTLAVHGTLAVAGSLAVAGTLNVIGTVSGSATVSGHALVLSGAVASGLALTAGGSALIAAGGTLGDATLADGGRMLLLPGAIDTATMSFSGAGGRVVSGDNSPGFTVAGFGLGDIVDLRGLVYAKAGSATLSGTTLTVAEGGQYGHIQFAAGSSFAGLDWVTKADPLGGTEITLQPV